MNKIAGVLLAVIGAVALAGIALHRHEPINALWIVTAAVCVYALGYRFYARMGRRARTRRRPHACHAR